MLIAGAKGHAIEILQIIEKSKGLKEIYFFDNISKNITEFILDKFKILRNENEVKKLFQYDNRYIIGVGNPRSRKILADILSSWGGKLTSVCSSTAIVGSYAKLGDGLNIMSQVFISNDVSIDRGTLLNTACSVHHGVSIGEFCEISPGARILGDVKLGDNCRIGANATVLPKLELGSNVVVGAGAVVTKKAESNSVLVGIPAKIIKKINPAD